MKHDKKKKEKKKKLEKRIISKQENKKSISGIKIYRNTAKKVDNMKNTTEEGGGGEARYWGILPYHVSSPYPRPLIVRDNKTKKTKNNALGVYTRKTFKIRKG